MAGGARIARDTLETTNLDTAQKVIIPSGDTTTGILTLLGQYAWGTFQLPATMTGTQVTVNYCNDGTNGKQAPTLSHETNPVTPAANSMHVIPAMAFAAKGVEFVSNASEGADREILLFLKT